jgi:hypothetical protein
MATNIQASPTSGLIISPDQSGVLTLQSGSNTATMPAATGTVMVSGNMPTFSYYLTNDQTVSTGTTTKLQFSNKNWDTNNNFDGTTNYRFTPTVAGYYQVNISAYGGSGQNTFLVLYKNGSAYNRGTQVVGAASEYVLSSMVYLNGSTDYIEAYITNNTGSSITVNAYSFTTQFSGFLARTA